MSCLILPLLCVLWLAQNQGSTLKNYFEISSKNNDPILMLTGWYMLWVCPTMWWARYNRSISNWDWGFDILLSILILQIIPSVSGRGLNRRQAHTIHALTCFKYLVTIKLKISYLFPNLSRRQRLVETESYFCLSKIRTCSLCTDDAEFMPKIHHQTFARQTVRSKGTSSSVILSNRDAYRGMSLILTLFLCI